MSTDPQGIVNVETALKSLAYVDSPTPGSGIEAADFKALKLSVKEAYLFILKH